jgi:hypothetical protein
MSHDWYTWKEFKALVDIQLPLDSNRLGLEEYYPQKVRDAILDLQHYIPRYRKHNEAIYYETDVVQNGRASIGSLPPHGAFKEAWKFGGHHFHRPDQFNQPLTISSNWGWRRGNGLAHCRDYKWEARYDLANGCPHHWNGQPFIALSDDNETFWLYPNLCNGERLSIVYDGFKLTFNDDELVPFDELTASVVASYVTAKIALYVEHDENRHMEEMKNYALLRKNLFLQTNG